MSEPAGGEADLAALPDDARQAIVGSWGEVLRAWATTPGRGAASIVAAMFARAAELAVRRAAPLIVARELELWVTSAKETGNDAVTIEALETRMHTLRGTPSPPWAVRKLSLSRRRKNVP
jgi:hypothetical protein